MRVWSVRRSEVSIRSQMVYESGNPGSCILAHGSQTRRRHLLTMDEDSNILAVRPDNAFVAHYVMQTEPFLDFLDFVEVVSVAGKGFSGEAPVFSSI